MNHKDDWVSVCAERVKKKKVIAPSSPPSDLLTVLMSKGPELQQLHLHSLTAFLSNKGNIMT